MNVNFVATVYELPKFDEHQEALLVVQKKLKIVGKLYSVGPAKHVRWVIGLPMA